MFVGLKGKELWDTRSSLGPDGFPTEKGLQLIAASPFLSDIGFDTVRGFSLNERGWRHRRICAICPGSGRTKEAVSRGGQGSVPEQGDTCQPETQQQFAPRLRMR